MIRYRLTCDAAHEFEGWFSTGADFESQMMSGFLSCPTCGSGAISKLLMAPSVTTGRQKDATRTLVMDTMQKEAMAKMRQAVAAVKANAEDVGMRFPEEARKIHYGEADARGIIGQAAPDEVLALIEEGIDVAPLPVLPDDVN